MTWRELVWEYICNLAEPGQYFNIRELGQHYEEISSRKGSANPFVAEKVRQQLQILRDSGNIAFITPGSYKRLK